MQFPSRRLATAAAASVMATVPAAAAVATAGTTAGPTKAPVALADQLRNPRQLAFAPDGSLYAAIAGSGSWHSRDHGGCGPGPEGPTVCAGDTGGILRVAKPGGAAAGTGRLVLRHVLSIGDQGAANDPPGSSAVGLDAVSFAPNGTEYAIVTFAPPPLLKGLPKSVQTEAGKLVRITKRGKVQPLADVAGYSLNHPEADHAPDTDPYGILALNRRVFIADAANDTLLQWRHGKLTTVRVFPYRHGDGSDGSYDTVPTSLATDGKHLYVGALGSMIPGHASVYELGFGGKVIRQIPGLSQVTAVAANRHGQVWVAELFGGQSGPIDSNGRPTGLIVRIDPNGKTRTLTHLPAPGGVAVGHGHLYASTWSVSPTTGAVVRLH